MKNFSILKSIVCLLVLIAGYSVNAYAQQTGKIVGRVMDKSFNEPLVGLPVSVKGSSKVSPTNVEGRYEFKLAPGKYTLVFQYISYQSKTVTDVEVRAGQVAELNVVLEDSKTELNEVVVTSSYKKESVNAIYSIQKASPRVSDGISAEIIRKSPDKNTGEVLKRVSGTSIQDNKFVIVRGLGERYNAALLNNVTLPSTEPDRKAFSFDIIPSNLIDNIIINKTATPDLPGDFSGGAIQINTKDFPDQKFLTFSLGYGYNSLSTFKDYNRGSTEKWDWVGLGNYGDRKLPEAYSSIKHDYLNIQPFPSTQQQTTQQFPNTYGVGNSGTNLPNQNYQIAFGNNKGFSSGSKLGFIAAMNYRQSSELTSRQRNEYLINYTQTSDYTDNSNNYSNTLGALLNVAYSFNKSKISIKNLFNNSFYNNYIPRTGAYFDDSGSALYIKGSQTDVSQSTLFNSVLEGQHTFEKSKWTIDWNASYGVTTKKQPDQRIMLFQTRDLTQPYYLQLSNYNNPSIQNAGRLYSDLHEDIYNANLAFSHPFKLFGQTIKVKVGATTLYRKRDYSVDALGYSSPNFAGDVISEDNGTTQENVFSQANVEKYGMLLSTVSSNSVNYQGTMNLNGGYLMLDNKLTDKWRLVWGARVESFNQNLTPDSKTQSEQKYSNTDILPSANLTYALTPRANLRFSGSQTINRPEFREIAGYSYYDYVIDYSVAGNANLKRAKSTNFDFRYEMYPVAGEIISASLFYKKFSNPIEQVNFGNRNLSYENATEATDYGVELELRKRLSFINDSGLFNNLSFYANASIIHSNVTVGNAAKSRPLQGQSPYLINSGLYYTSADNNWSANVLYNRFGQRLIFRGQGAGLDTYEKSRNVIDFQISKKVLKKSGEFKLTVSDLLAQPTQLYYNYDNASTFSRNDRVVNSIQAATTVSLGFTYNFQFNNSKY